MREPKPLRIIVRRRREPLDLDAQVFRYLIDRYGAIQPMREVAVPFCSCCRSRS